MIGVGRGDLKRNIGTVQFPREGAATPNLTIPRGLQPCSPRSWRSLPLRSLTARCEAGRQENGCYLFGLTTAVALSTTLPTPLRSSAGSVTLLVRPYMLEHDRISIPAVIREQLKLPPPDWKLICARSWC